MKFNILEILSFIFQLIFEFITPKHLPLHHAFEKMVHCFPKFIDHYFKAHIFYHVALDNYYIRDETNTLTIF